MCAVIRQLLALPKSVESDLAAVLTALYEQRYTGPITFHFHHGVAKAIQVPSPEIRLSTPTPPASEPPPAPSLSTPDRPSTLTRA